MGLRPTMPAVVLQEYGSPLVSTTLPVPEPREGEVLVRVAASGVNPLDLKIARGEAAHARVRPPAVLGIDLAGTVVRTGPSVTGFAAGDRVYGMTGGVGELQGSLAGFVAVDARLLAPAPRTLDLRAAAALPLAAVTAWEALVDRASVQPGDSVLVHGGAGGVGHIAVQIARARGAQVFATGSGTSLDLIAQYGAVPIDYTVMPVDEYVGRHTEGEGFDIVLDTVGGAVLDASFTAVKTYTGRVVSILGWGTHALAPLSFRGATYSGVFTLLPLLTGRSRDHHGAVLDEVTALVDDGVLSPRIDPATYDLASVAAAHAAVETGSADGKVVISVAGSAG